MTATTSPTMLITTLAEYQTRFWLPVAQWLRESGRDVCVLAFDDRSAEMLERAGVINVNMYATGLGGSGDIEDMNAFRARLRTYQIDNPNLLFSHERVTFGIRDTAKLARRFMIYSNAMEKVLDQLQATGSSAVLIQELGGFLSVIASYFAARRRGIDNWFIEPSFFRGRLFFIRNSFAAKPAMATPANEVGQHVASYLEDTIKRRAIVVPIKDRHQYTTAFSKVANTKNLRRFVEKVYDQYVLGKHQEFGHNLKHARGHVRMAINAVRMLPHYRELAPGERFVYFPLHVPGDMALTLRSPEYLDQIALVDYLLRVMPMSHTLVIKEHPAQVGAIPASRLKQLLERYDNLKVLPPKTNNYAVLANADAVVSINSKSGAEALLLGRPVVVLGDAFYTTCPLVFGADRRSDLATRLSEALTEPKADARQVVSYFQTAWDMSYPGELYANNQVETICRSIITTTSGDGSPQAAGQSATATIQSG